MNQLENRVRELIERSFPEKAAFFKLRATPWYALFGNIKDTLQCFPSPQTERLLMDIQEGMDLHGVAPKPPVWLRDLIDSRLRHLRGIREESLHYFLASKEKGAQG